jgi:hypothetical protein
MVDTIANPPKTEQDANTVNQVPDMSRSAPPLGSLVVPHKTASQAVTSSWRNSLPTRLYVAFWSPPTGTRRSSSARHRSLYGWPYVLRKRSNVDRWRPLFDANSHHLIATSQHLWEGQKRQRRTTAQQLLDGSLDPARRQRPARCRIVARLYDCRSCSDRNMQRRWLVSGVKVEIRFGEPQPPLADNLEAGPGYDHRARSQDLRYPLAT